MDWLAIKQEYMAGGVSYRSLAKKYDVSLKILSRRAKKERWVELRRQAEDKAGTELACQIGSKQARTEVKVNAVADRLLRRIEALVDSTSSPKDIRHLTASLKDIKDIKGIKSKEDAREQEARIRRLELEIGRESRDDRVSEIRVVFEDGEEAWNE